MANQKISQLPSVSTTSGSDLYTLVQNGANASITYENLSSAINSTLLSNGEITSTQLSYLAGSTSNIQAQINAVTAHGSITATGTATLTAGAVTVATAVVTSSTVIMLTTQAMGGTIGIQYVTNRVPGTSFGINSSSSSDTSTVGYVLIEP